jgi:penicillin amidase
MHLLDPRFGSWEELFLASLDEVLDELTEGGVPLATRTWGDHNRIAVRHPLSAAVPALGRWLDMPVRVLPGDGDMPRVQHTFAGASERFAVSPGREESGYFHMPCGQSGHPLSPHYSDGHDAWAEGTPTAFLPGPAVQVLTFRPE